MKFVPHETKGFNQNNKTNQDKRTGTNAINPKKLSIYSELYFVVLLVNNR